MLSADFLYCTVRLCLRGGLSYRLGAHCATNAMVLWRFFTISIDTAVQRAIQRVRICFLLPQDRRRQSHCVSTSTTNDAKYAASAAGQGGGLGKAAG